MSTAMTESRLPLRSLGRGKVRDLYEVDADRLLLVATDRISAFDVVMAETIPQKGTVLTQLSAWWCERLSRSAAGWIRHHLISANADEILEDVPALAPHREEIEGRAMLVHRTEVFPVECVVRGYISGSAWKEYAAHGTLAGEPLPAGLMESERLDPPIFSPATKAVTGHDENITIARMTELIGAEVAVELERISHQVYSLGTETAAERGIIIADTKFEFGRAADGGIMLVDEVLTPDSSRFWPAARYAPGRSQPSFDKQPLRDYLERERIAGRWNGEPPPPALPADVVHATSVRYRELYRTLTGRLLEAGGEQ